MVIRKIYQFKVENYSLYAWEIREKLLRENVCTRATLPSISSINRILRHTYRKTGSMLTKTTTNTIKSNNKLHKFEVFPEVKHLKVGHVNSTMGANLQRDIEVMHLPKHSNHVFRSMSNLSGQSMSPATSTFDVAVVELSKSTTLSTSPTITPKSANCHPQSFAHFTTDISEASNPHRPYHLPFISHNDKTVNGTKSMFTLYDTLNPFQGFFSSTSVTSLASLKTVQPSPAPPTSTTASTSNSHVSNYLQPEVIINGWTSFEQHNLQDVDDVDGSQYKRQCTNDDDHDHQQNPLCGKRKLKTFLIEDILC